MALLLLMGTRAAAQQPPAPKPKLKPKLAWDLRLGLSYLATTGNTDTSSAGIDASYRQAWGPWSLEGTAAAVQAARNDEETAENYTVQLRGQRKIADALEITTGLKGERNRFAGLDYRTILDTSLRWSLFDSPLMKIHTLSGLSWTREEPRGERPFDDSFGALLQINSLAKLSPTAEFNSQITTYPDLEDTDDYRINGHLAIQAALNAHLALRLGYELRYDNEPVRGFERTDTTSTASLVVQLGRKAG
jgi:putative salt-induced outer membrane protein